MRNCNQLNSSRASPRDRDLWKPTPDPLGLLPLCLGKPGATEEPGAGWVKELDEGGQQAEQVVLSYLDLMSLSCLSGCPCVGTGCDSSSKHVTVVESWNGLGWMGP